MPRSCSPSSNLKRKLRHYCLHKYYRRPYKKTQLLFFIFTDDEDTVVHGILTADHLFDGTITTKFEHFYVEPAHRYGQHIGGGIHSIVYKVSDVEMPKQMRSPQDDATADDDHHYCASERLRKKLKNEFKRRRKTNEGGDAHIDGGVDKKRAAMVHKVQQQMNKIRRKRFLPEEVSARSF